MKTIKSYIVHPEAVKKIKTDINSGKLKLKADNHIIFVFGAEKSDKFKTARQTFLEYAKKHLSNYIFLLAEEFFNFFNNDYYDLLTIENNLATYTDCVIILLESNGAIAELGAFSNRDDLTKKMLVINDKEYQKSKSFINLGPLKKLERKSKFGGAIFVDLKKITTIVGEIEKRLSDKLRKNSKTVDLSNKTLFLDKEYKKYKLLLIYDLISLLNPIKREELLEVLTTIYALENIYIDIEISLLSSIGFIKEINNYLIKTFDREFYFYQFKSDNNKIRYQVFNHYAKHYPQRLQILK